MIIRARVDNSEADRGRCDILWAVNTGIEDLIGRQHGLISRRQALQLGLSSGGVQARVSRGEWRRVQPGVYLARTHGLTPVARLWAAWLAVPDSVTSGACAAWWSGLTDRWPGVVELAVPRDRTVARRPGITIVRRDLDPLDVTTRRGLAVTGFALSVLHGAVALGSDGPAMMDRALQRSLSFANLHAAYCRQIGSRRSRQSHLLMAAAGDNAAAQSERLLITLFKRAGISGWSVNTRLALPGGHEVFPDFTFRQQRVLIEVDGWAWHHSPERFARDRQRQNALVLAGWTVLRFTWFDLTQRPAAVLAEIRAALVAAPVAG